MTPITVHYRDRAVGLLIAAVYRAAMALDRIRHPGGTR